MSRDPHARPAPGTADGAPALRIALAGNPNAGKTTIFNTLTGSRQHVGNYPGVTVEKKEGTLLYGSHEIRVTDLPGTYSLTAASADELVARNFILEEQPDLVVNVVDASNLERNLYLTVQLMELGVPLVLAFNMSDAAEQQGIAIDIERLAALLGVRIVRTVGHRGVGLDELKQVILEVAENRKGHAPASVRYGREIATEVSGLTDLLARRRFAQNGTPPPWVAVKLLEGDEEVRRLVSGHLADSAPVLAAAEVARLRIEKHFGDRAEIVIADQRYGFISGACQESVHLTVQMRHSRSDRIDEVVTSRLFGLPLFLALMYGVFKLTFRLGDPATRALDALFAWTGARAAALWPEGTPHFLQSLVQDGVLAGVGGVVSFLPSILLLFAAIAILEDSGYMARAAFLTDQFMHRIGLHGRSFIPVLIGFGCTVPAILATRALESRRDRLTTMLVLPLISCSARLPIYTLFIGALFPPGWRGPMLMTFYLIGVGLAALLAKLLRVSVLRGETMPFVMELPPYRMPTLRGVLTHTWERGWLFLRKAGTVILGASVLLWTLSNYPKPPAEALAGRSPEDSAQIQLAHSAAGRVGKAIEPAMRWIGFDWKTSTALIGAFAAKELFVAQLGIVNAVGQTDQDSVPLRSVLQREYTPLRAFCIMLFCLISMPCVATFAAVARESGSWRWALLQLGGLTTLAYLVTLVAYQAGRLMLASA